MKWTKTNTTLQQNLQQRLRTDFTVYHAQYPEHERRRTVDELVNGKSSHRVLFVTVAFGIGIDCNNIHRIVHIGVRYTRLGGLAEMAFQLGLTLIIILMTFQKPVKNMPEANMMSYVQSKECKREIILNYFDHKAPDNQLQDHTCCDFHRLHCQCENCMLVHAAEQVEALSVQDESEMTLTEQNEGNSQFFTSEAKLKIKQDIEKYRFQLQKDIGRSTVGNVALSSGFPIEMISLVLEHLPDLGRFPFNQNFRKFRSETEWNSSVQPEIFRKKMVHLSRWTTFSGWTGLIGNVRSIGQILVSSTSLSVSICNMAGTQNFQCYLCGYIAVDLSTLLMHPCAVSTGIAC